MSVSRRVWITEPALVKALDEREQRAERRGRGRPRRCSAPRSRCGHSITITPTKPTATALQR